MTSLIGTGSSLCPLRLSVAWVADVGQPVFAAPAVVPHIDGENGNQIIGVGVEGSVFALDPDGSFSAGGWPFQLQGGAVSHASPVVLDPRLDGTSEVLVSLVSGGLTRLWSNLYSAGFTPETWEIPTLFVRKDWYENTGGTSSPSDMAYFRHRSLLDTGIGAMASVHDGGGGAFQPKQLRRRLQADGGGAEADRWPGGYAGGGHNAMYGEDSQPADAQAVKGEAGSEGPYDPSMFEQDLYGYGGAAAFYGDDMMSGYWGAGNDQGPPEGAKEGDYLAVDGHLLAAPAITALYGASEVPWLVAPASYFFDRHRYVHSPPQDGTKREKYVAGALVCFNMMTGGVEWSTLLDITTDEDNLRGYLYASPTVADIDGDGSLEVMVGSAAGKLYVLEAATGEVRQGFPRQFGGEIQAQVAVADVAGDDSLEIIFGDMAGNLVCISASGEEVWRRELSGQVTNSVSIGDVDGDGSLDVAVAVSNGPGGEGRLWLLRASNGETLPGYPMRLSSSALSAPPLLVDLHASRPRSSPSNGLHVVVPSLDGHVYVVEAATRCANKIDIGAHSHAMVVADDVTGEGTLDLIVSTMTGEVIVLTTGVQHHPLNAWPAQPRGRRNGFVHGSSAGVFIINAGKDRYLPIVGERAELKYEVVDERPNPAVAAASKRSYKVVVSSSAEAATSSHGGVLVTQNHATPGVYTVSLAWLRPRAATVTVVVTTEHGLVFEDSVRVGYNLGFHATLKWMIAIPMLLAAVPVLLLHSREAPLPV